MQSNAKQCKAKHAAIRSIIGSSCTGKVRGKFSSFAHKRRTLGQMHGESSAKPLEEHVPATDLARATAPLPCAAKPGNEHALSDALNWLGPEKQEEEKQVTDLVPQSHATAASSREVPAIQPPASAMEDETNQESTRIKAALKRIYNNVGFNASTNQWVLPNPDMGESLNHVHWPKMLGMDEFPPTLVIDKVIPTFYVNEPDPNRADKPRLDILVCFTNGSTVRYHPQATPIWSNDPQPTDAVRTRLNRAANLARARQR